MSAPVPPPGAPRPTAAGTPPPPNYRPANVQQNPNALADNFQNLNINRPPMGMPQSAPNRPPPPFGQAPQFPSSQGMPAPSSTFSRPGPPPPGAVARPAPPMSGTPQSGMPPTMAGVRPAGPPPVSQPPSFGSRPPPPGSLHSSLGSGLGPTPPPMGPASSVLPSPGPSMHAPPQPGAPVQPGPRPGPFASSSPLTTSPAMTPQANQVGAFSSNGPSAAFGPPGALGSGRFPPPGGALPQKPPFGAAQPTGIARAPPGPPTVRTLLGNPTVNAPPGPPGQPTGPFSATPQGSPPSIPPYGAQQWPMQPGQVTVQSFLIHHLDFEFEFFFH